METEAIETRSKTLRDKASSQVLYLPHDEEHDQRQAFRKRVNYIIGATKRVQAVESLKVCIPDSPRRAEAVVDLVGVVGCFGACAQDLAKPRREEGPKIQDHKSQSPEDDHGPQRRLRACSGGELQGYP